MLSIFHVFCDRRTSGAVLFAQIWNLSRDFDVPLANSKTSLCQLDNKLTRLVIIIVVICTRVWMYIAIMDEKFQRRNYWIINVDILFTVYFTAAEKTLLLTTLNSRYRSMIHSPSIPTKRIPEADIKLVDHVDSLKFGWYPFAQVKIFRANVERLSWEKLRLRLCSNQSPVIRLSRRLCKS